MEYRIAEYNSYSAKEILPLYAAVGWTNYTDRSGMLRKAYANSLCTLAAYDGENVVGVIRAVGDGASIVFIQDLLIYPAYQRMGIGSALLRAMMARYPEVYQMELMTDDTPRLRGFYESVGLTDAAELGCLTYVKLQ